MIMRTVQYFTEQFVMRSPPSFFVDVARFADYFFAKGKLVRKCVRRAAPFFAYDYFIFDIHEKYYFSSSFLLHAPAKTFRIKKPYRISTSLLKHCPGIPVSNKTRIAPLFP